MSPVRVGLVGLSPTSTSGWAQLTHLPYLQTSPHYEITGILNSSLESSRAAIQTFDLAATAKPYEDIESLAASPDVDLVVICVEVARHAELVKGAILNGKDVFCEWPLSRTSAEARDLAMLAESKGVNGYVNIESRLLPPTVRIKQLINDGAIGTVTSTSVTATLGPVLEVWSSYAMYYLDIESGQTQLHTRVGHFLEAFCHTVGEFDVLKSLLKTHRDKVRVYDVPISQLDDAARDPEREFREVGRTAPDEILVQGQLVTGAVASVHMQSGEADAEGKILRWIISGTEGVIEVTQTSGQFLRDASVKIQVKKEGRAVEEVEVEWDVDGDLIMFGDNMALMTTARNYKAIAEGDRDVKGRRWIGFRDAVKRHEMLDRIVLLGRSVG
jgi:predicted dehydrogenase